MRVALVTCVKAKRPAPAAARELYTSQLFRALRAYAEGNADQWYILSAKHHLVRPTQVLAPYERTLNKLSKSERGDWTSRVQDQLLQVLPKGAEVIILAGLPYRQGIVPFLRRHGFKVTVPLEGLTFGRQLRWLKANARRTDLRSHVDRFYELLGMLAALPDQGKEIGQYTGRSNWPQRGVYFFQEPREYRASRTDLPRIVRVGTHAVSKEAGSKLWGRLRAHRGARDGRGNHRGSIFRLHVGAALLNRDRRVLGDLPTWGFGRSAARAVREVEADHERRVSQYLGKMRVFWLAVPDAPGPASARAYIERNAIALLSNQLAPIDPPSAVWLGLHSDHAEIRGSGLWNLKHVHETYDPAFLDSVAEFIAEMRG